MKKIFISIIVSVVTLLPYTTHASTALLKEVSIDADKAQAAKNSTFTLTSGSRKWVVPVKDARLWFKTRTLDSGSVILQLHPQAIYDYLNVYVSPRVNKLGENSRFEYIGTNLHLIEGGRKGEIVDGVKTSLLIRDALVSGNRTVK